MEAELVNYIFHKIRLTWGDKKYNSEFLGKKTLEDTLEDTKRDWAADLIAAIRIRRDRRGTETEDEFIFRCKDRIDRIFSEIRVLLDNGSSRAWEWPSLKKIISYMHHFQVHRSHMPPRIDRALEDKGKIERNRKAGAKELGVMKGMFA